MVLDKMNFLENESMSSQNHILACLRAIGGIAVILPSLTFADGSALPEYRNGTLLTELSGFAPHFRLSRSVSHWFC